ncbi:MAG TPA: choice-of-anchor D domain-containing protein [Acidimicrobiales bacterium]|nr:choice-of-anchor D domain-containing protein [Acidimicrobiales bacterium]
MVLAAPRPRRRRPVRPAALAAVLVGTVVSLALAPGTAAASGADTGQAALAVAPSPVVFGAVRVGHSAGPVDLTVQDTGGSEASVSVIVGGADPGDFAVEDGCGALAPGGQCALAVSFLPEAPGARQADLVVSGASSGSVDVTLQGTGTEGYEIVTSTGAVHGFGDAGAGAPAAPGQQGPAVAAAPTPDGDGWWSASAAGAVVAGGDAPTEGSLGVAPARPVVGMAATPDGRGYWLVASDGGVFAFGDAPFLGSVGGTGVTGVIGLLGTAGPTLQSVRDAPATLPVTG